MFLLHKIAKSKSVDLLGVAIVVVCAYLSGYMFENLDQVTHWGGLSVFVPFGIISVASSCVSVLSDRLVARMNNLGNWFGLFAVVVSGTVDYLLGNQGAIFTYPLTFIIQAVAIHAWMKSDKYKASKPLSGAKGLFVIILTIVGSLAFSYWVNGLGFTQHNALFYLTTVVFASSLIANILNAQKLSMQWPFWVIYNLIQLVKNAVQGNIANVGKYLYYIINSVCGLSMWTDSRKAGSHKVARKAVN